MGAGKAGAPVGAAAAAPSAREASVRCPLCGTRFPPAEAPACQYCRRMFRSCGLVSCPRCGHEFPVSASR